MQNKFLLSDSKIKVMKQYLINCVGSTAELISAMVEQAEEITYEELLQHVT